MAESRYGVWNLEEKRFVFNINESSKTRAMRELQRRIGAAALNHSKYVPRVIKPGWKNPQNERYANYPNNKRHHTKKKKITQSPNAAKRKSL